MQSNLIKAANMISSRFLLRSRPIFSTFSRPWTRHTITSLSSPVRANNLVQRDQTSSLLSSIRANNSVETNKTPALSSSLSANNSVQPNQTSLAWVQLHDESPSGYGIQIWGGYYEMIPAKASLPFEKTENFETVKDYLKSDIFLIQYRQSILKAPVDLAKVQLDGIRVAKKGIPHFKATLKIGKDLVGHFKVHDTWTRSAASIVFDAGVAFRAPRDPAIVVRDDDSLA